MGVNVEQNTLMLLLCNIMYVKRYDQLLLGKQTTWTSNCCVAMLETEIRGGSRFPSHLWKGGDHVNLPKMFQLLYCVHEHNLSLKWEFSDQTVLEFPADGGHFASGLI